LSDELTKKQQCILDFIKEEVALKGYPPSVREICDAVGLKSTSTVHGHLTRLEKKGYIRRDSTKPRAIELLGAEDNVVPFHRSTTYVPIVGNVTAGEPILAVENVEESFPLPAEFVDNGDYFMLQIQGDSMIEAGIFDRDYVLIKQQEDAINGDIVVAMIDDHATVKTFYKESNRFRLQPENQTLDPIYSDHVDILGIVKGVYRKM